MKIEGIEKLLGQLNTLMRREPNWQVKGRGKSWGAERKEHAVSEIAERRGSNLTTISVVCWGQKGIRCKGENQSYRGADNSMLKGWRMVVAKSEEEKSLKSNNGNGRGG